MDILAYNEILEGLQEHCIKNSQNNFGNVVVPLPPNNPTYPLTIFDEIRNQSIPEYNSRYEKVSSLGYKVDIYAKNKQKVDKQSIARIIAKQIDDYLTNKVGLSQTSWNVYNIGNDMTIYHIVMTYTGKFYENRKNFI